MFIFHGIPDAEETREQKGETLTSELCPVMVSFQTDRIERAQRLGYPLLSKYRPIMAKFTHCKLKEKVLSPSSQPKPKDIAVNEYCFVTTCLARRKLKTDSDFVT